MKIIINEQQYNLIVEKLGVPDDIYNSAIRLYQFVINELEHKQDRTFNQNVTLMSYDMYKINQHLIRGYKLILTPEMMESRDLNNIPKPIILGLAHHSQDLTLTRYKNSYALNLPEFNRDNVSMVFNFGIPKEQRTTIGEIYELLKENKNTVVSAISHELMHYYEESSKKKLSVITSAKYQGMNHLHSGIKELDTFLYGLYYVSSTEKITRLTEFYSLLMLDGVTKKTFKQYLVNSEMYTTLKQISNFNYLDMKASLKNDMEHVNLLIDSFSNINANGMTDEKKIDTIIMAVYTTIYGKTANALVNLLSQNGLEVIFGLSGDKQRFLDRYVEKMERNEKEYDQFFLKLQKKINFTGEELIKKLSKLYSMLPDE